MSKHPVCRADARRLRFVIAKQKLTDFHERKSVLAQCQQRLFYLIECGNQTAQESSGLESGAYLPGVIVRIGNIEEESIHVRFVEAFLDKLVNWGFVAEQLSRSKPGATSVS